MSDLNNITIIGNLTADPVNRTTPGGHALAVFTIASNHTYKKGDEKVQEATFIDCTAWGNLGDVICRYTKKGNRIGIIGRLRQERWEGNDGKPRTKHSIVISDIQFLTSKSESSENQSNSPDPNQNVDWD